MLDEPLVVWKVLIGKWNHVHRDAGLAEFLGEFGADVAFDEAVDDRFGCLVDHDQFGAPCPCHAGK